MKNITEPWTQFNTDPTDNTGHFFPIELDKKYDGEKITVIGKRQKTDASRFWVLRAENSKNGKFTFKKGSETLFVLDLSGAAPMGEQAIDPAKKDFGRFGKWEEYCDGVSIDWDGVKGTVKGTIKHHGEIGTVKAGNHFPLGLVAFYFDGVPKSVTIGSGSAKSITDKDIICDVSKSKTIKVEWAGVSVLELDLTGATIASS